MVKNKTVSAINFYYSDGCDIKYDTYYACRNDSDCCKDGYCRCGVIQNAKVITPPTMDSVVDQVCNVLKLKDELDRYAVNRILTINKAYDVDCYEVRVQRGYYGEEINGVYFESNKIESDLETYTKLQTNSGKIEYILELEYGHLIDSVKNRNWEIKVVDKDKIEYNDNHMRKIDKNNYWENYRLPIAVVLQDGDDPRYCCYRLVDGYHRFVNSDDGEITVIVGT